MSMYRCAACGSSNVIVDTKKEGYSIGKGVAGTVLLGPVGAVAGVNGKKTMYYHCTACGQTLSYPMSDDEKNFVNLCLKNPSIFSTTLPILKKKYPNIEYVNNNIGNINNNDKGNSLKEMSKKEKTDADLADDIWRYYLRTQISVVPVSVLEDEVLGEDDKWRVNEAIDILEKRGCVTTTSEFGQRLCNFYTNPEDIKRNLYKVKCVEDASIIVEEKYDKILELFTAFMKKQEKAINIQEAKEWLASEVIRCGYTQDECTSGYIAHNIIVDACLEYIIDFVDLEDDSQEYIKILSQEESKALKEKDDREIKEKKEKEFRPIREELLRILAGDVKMTVWEIKSASGMLNEYSTFKITSWLEWREKVGEVEEVTENGKRYFMLKGATERLRQKKEEEERQELKRREEEERQELKRKEEERLQELSRRENVKKHNDEIDKKISVLESDISKWEKIYSENKNKLFGDGAKAKKEAQMKLEELKMEITSLENKKVWALP